MIFDAIFYKQKGEFHTELKSGINHANLKVEAIVKSIRKNLIQRDLISLLLAKQRKKFTFIGIVITILGFIGILPVVLFFDFLTISALLLVFTLIISGIIIILGAQSITPLTPQGMMYSQQVYYHKRHLEDLLSKEYSIDIHNYLLTQIPCLFAYNLQSRWFSRLKSKNYPLPEWFVISAGCSGQETSECFNLFLSTMLIYSNSATTSSAGSTVGGGIAGGGSSSAG